MNRETTIGAITVVAATAALALYVVIFHVPSSFPIFLVEGLGVLFVAGAVTVAVATRYLSAEDEGRSDTGLYG